MITAIFLLAAVDATPAAIVSDETWWPINAADLALRSSLIEPNADAEAIFWDVRIDYSRGDELLISHYIRIKVFSKLGCEKQGKVEIPYLSGTRISDVRARTVGADNSAAELAAEDIFDRTIIDANGRKLSVISFAFPHLEPGAIIEYKWKEVIPRSSSKSVRLQFQRSVPIESVRYHIKPAHSFKGNFPILAFNMPTPIFAKDKDGFYSTTVMNMAAFHAEPLMPPEESVWSWAMINYRTDSSEFGYTLLASRLYDVFQQLLKVDEDVKAKSAEITAGAVTAEEKLARILAFCRTNIKNTDDPTVGSSSDEVEQNKRPADTLKRGVGTEMDIDLLFAALANAAGLEARVALLPDRSVTFFRRNRVVPGSLRPAVIAVLVKREWKFFDPGFRYSQPGMLRWQEEGVDALITDPSPEWTRTPQSSPATSKQLRVAKLQLNEDGAVEGDVMVEYSGHFSIERKEISEGNSPALSEEQLKQTVTERLGTAELSAIAIENVKDPVKPYVYKYHIRVPEYAQRTGKRIFLQPAFFEKGIAPLFTAATRKYGVYFHFAWSEDDTVTILLPKGYMVENVEAAKPISAGGVARYDQRLEISSDGSSLTYHRSFFFGGGDQLYISPESYPQLKLFFDQVNRADALAIPVTVIAK